LCAEGTAWRLVQNLTSEVADITIKLDGTLTPPELCKIATDHINTMLKLKGETCESKG